MAYEDIRYVEIKEDLKERLRKYGQYRDVWYTGKDGTPVERRCLVVPSEIVEHLIKESDVK